MTAAEELMLVQPEIRVEVETLDDRMTAVVTVESHNPRRLQVRVIDGIWTAHQAIQHDDGEWGPWFRVPRIPRHPVPRDARELVAFCRWLYQPLTVA